MNEEALTDLFRRIKEAIDEYLAEGKTSIKDRYANLDWRNYRRGPGQWIFTDRAPQELVRMLKQAEGHTVWMDGYRYSFSGDRHQFIRRVPTRRR